MSRVPFTKLGLKKIEDIKTITLNKQEVEVKQYLPVEQKLTLIADVLNQSADADNNNFMNPVKVDIFTHLNIIFNYTNLTFTDKQKENPAKLYDLLETNGVINSIISVIPEDEYSNLVKDIEETISAYHTFKNSALGILEAISTDYSNLDLDATKIQQKLAESENITFLKDVMTKLP